jgi:hypothetical protein
MAPHPSPDADGPARSDARGSGGADTPLRCHRRGARQARRDLDACASLAARARVAHATPPLAGPGATRSGAGGSRGCGEALVGAGSCGRGRPATTWQLPAYCNCPTPTVSIVYVASRQPPSAVSQTREATRDAPVRTGPPSKSVQPPMLSATAISLASPYFARFASFRVPENRGVGSSILPLTTNPDSGS